MMVSSPGEVPITPGSLVTPALPDLQKDQSLVEFVGAVSAYITEIVDAPYTFERLRTDVALLRSFTNHLSEDCHRQDVVAALLSARWKFINTDHDDSSILETRALACEIVAWRFLNHLSEAELLDFLLYELPGSKGKAPAKPSPAGQETDPLLSGHQDRDNEDPMIAARDDSEIEEMASIPFAGLNALEIASVAGAKKFLSQPKVQKIVNSIWSGQVIFWDSLSVNTKKKGQMYNSRKTDPYARLRVPKYQKVFEAIFFASFLAIYYAVLLERNPSRVTITEIMLYIWIAAFACEEFGEYRDTGTLFYVADIWNLTDICIMLVAVAFLLTRIIGLVQADERIINVSFDILSLEALFLFPRLFALLSIDPYFGTLIPCLKEMTKDFVKFLGVVVIVYLGFLTTFTMLGRDEFTLKQMSWYLIYVFFGSSYMGFDIASKISEVMGPPLMIIFVAMTNILLITSLISLLSNSLTKVMDHAKEEYLFQYSVFVLEASASRRLTYYFPPMNLIPLLLLRPLRLFIPAENLRGARIMLLKITHLPHIALILTYEALRRLLLEGKKSGESESESMENPGFLAPQPVRSLGRARKSRPSTLIAVKGKSETWSARNNGAAQGSYCAASTEMDELKLAIAKLSRQVEELTTLVDPRQR